MTDYNGWTIRYRLLSAGDVEEMAQTTEALKGLDLDASVQRYRELLQKRLEGAFPGANIEPGRRVGAYGPNWVIDGPDQAAEQTIYDITEDLQIRDAADWLVDTDN